MPKPLATTAAYRRLLADIRKEMARGIRKVEELLERQKVLSYWGIGRRVHAYLKVHHNELPPGGVGQFYEDLGREVKMQERTLQQCEQFFRYFPVLKPHKNLKWSHYRFLLVVADAGERRRWLERIKKENIPANDLRLMLKPAAGFDEPAEFTLKNPVRGRLYTYRILRADDIENFEIPWFVDLGFASRDEAPASQAALDNKYLYTSEKSENGYRLKVTKAKVEELFTFRGKLRRVIDADTLFLLIDQGFGRWTEQTLRLKAIDAPELETLQGQRAKKWIEDELKGIENLVVKTYKTDQWDRYLVDVFYLRGEKDLNKIAAEGIWLNGKMLEEGIAQVWKR